MKEPQEPVRWDASESDAPDELKRALAALADAERPPAAELQRVRERLEAVFQAPAPRPWRLLHALQGSGGLLALGLLLVGGWIGWLQHERSEPARELPSSAVHESAPSEPVRASPAREAAVPATRAGAGEGAPALAAVSVSDDSGSTRRVRSGAARGVRAGSARAAAVESNGTHAGVARRLKSDDNAGSSRTAVGADRAATTGSDDHALGAASAAPQRIAGDAAARSATGSTSADAGSAREGAVPLPITGERRASADENSARVGAASVRSPAGDAVPSPRLPAADGGNTVLLDEATLLQRARRISSSQPETALRLLEEHKQRFPAGMLSPEREVLAIELLRSLARTQEAERRARDFRRDFPRSVYLSRIEP